MSQTEFRCKRCGETFTSDWSERDAHAEHKARFGVDPKASDAVLCDECYQSFLVWLDSAAGRAFDSQFRAEHGLPERAK